MAIPFIPTPSMEGTPLRQPSPRAASLGAPAVALGDVARGIASVSQAFAQHADQIQGFENARMESEARQKIAADLADFNNRAATMTDPAALLPELDNVLARTSGYVEDDNLPPAVRENLSQWHANAATSARLNTASKAASLSLRRAGMALQNELDAAMEHVDESAFESVATRLQESGLAIPEEIAAKRMKFQQIATQKQIAKAIDADPETSLEMLKSDDILTKYPNLTEDNRDQLIRYATVRKNEQSAQTWNQITIASLDGAVLSKEDVLNMAKEGEITGAQAGRYIATYHGETPPEFDPILFAEARAMIHTYDPAKDETGEKKANISRELGSLPLPKEHVKELLGQFEKVLNPDEEEKPKHRLATDYMKRIETEWKSEAFGEWFDYDSTEFTNKLGERKSATFRVIREKDFDKASAYRHRVQDNFLGWLNQQKPDITPDEVGKKYNEIKAQALDATAPLDFTPSMAPSFDDIDTLLSEPGSTPDGAPGVLPGKPTEPKTSAIKFQQPIKLSNYGYSSDSTPDSNSANGIGHRDNKLIDGRSAAITKSLADQIGLKHGDWFQVNTSRGTFKLQYADTVPAYDKRTGPLPPTIDIYRRKGGSNNWGGKIYSLEKLDTPPDTASTGNLEQRKAAYFRDQRPRTPDEAELGLAAIYDDFYTSQLPTA